MQKVKPTINTFITKSIFLISILLIILYSNIKNIMNTTNHIPKLPKNVFFIL